MLYYIHGYQSSPNSSKGFIFKKTLNAIPIKYRNSEPEDLTIKDCISEILNQIKDDKNIILIGSSLGGFLTAKTATLNKYVNTLILLNPAIIPPFVDINKISGIPKRILNDMKDENLFRKSINAKIFLLRGKKDEIVPDLWISEF